MADPIKLIEELDFRWMVENPFLFCAHHRDQFPNGQETLGPDPKSLIGRSMGNDFTLKDGWRMYHGETVPGFPAHPHRGFETVTIMAEGFVDHSDSHGASGRYGDGDVQWMTAGKGMQHAEMFPLIKQDEANPLHLFQVWLNLPAKDKFVEPHYKMLWSEDIPVIAQTDEFGKKRSIRLIAGTYQETGALEPAPDSWAHEPDHKVTILLVSVDPGATFELSPVNSTINRNIYFYEGSHLTINETNIDPMSRVKLDGNSSITITNGDQPGHFLLLEGEPISEPVVAYGPFVMNSMEEIRQAFHDFNETGFGGWPWDQLDPVNSIDAGRFAKYADGTFEER